MKKKEISTYINSKYPNERLNAGKNGNVVYANVNKTKDDLWWADVGIEKFDNDLHFILQNDFENTIIWVKIPENTFTDPLRVFYNKNEKQVSLYISTSSLLELKSKNKKIDFSKFKVHQFTYDDVIDDVEDNLTSKSKQCVGKIECGGFKKICGSRYKSKPIGDSQNAMIRSLLSTIGFEKISKNEWNSICEVHFEGKCAYCEARSEQIDHAIPMNKEDLGEHRLGNMVPSCRKCNLEKGQKPYVQYLSEKYGDSAIPWIDRIETHMEICGYSPLLQSNKKLLIRKMLSEAHDEVRTVFERYQAKLNKNGITGGEPDGAVVS